MSDLTWDIGRWTHEPARVELHGGDLLVTAEEGSDAWRHTSYGFVHDTEHALVAPLAGECAVEVDFSAAFSEQFDQAGIFLRASEEIWVKAGIELSDGVCQLGAVVTRGLSDWSVAPVPDWQGRRVRIRVSRTGNALTIRGGLVSADGGCELQLVRVVPMDPVLELEAGPFLCAPTRSGLTVPFHAWRVTEPDASLH